MVDEMRRPVQLWSGIGPLRFMKVGDGRFIAPVARRLGQRKPDVRWTREQQHVVVCMIECPQCGADLPVSGECDTPPVVARKLDYVDAMAAMLLEQTGGPHMRTGAVGLDKQYAPFVSTGNTLRRQEPPARTLGS